MRTQPTVYVTFAQDPAGRAAHRQCSPGSQVPRILPSARHDNVPEDRRVFQDRLASMMASPRETRRASSRPAFPSGAPGVNNTTVSIRPTRMNLDFRVPVKALGDVRFYVEADFFGSNSTTPRLRHAYTQVKNLLIGQTFSNFQDPDAGPDTLDFQGPNGQVAIRNPQIRYSAKLAEKTSLRFSVEKPSSDVAFKTPEFSALPNSPAPDGVVTFRQEYDERSRSGRQPLPRHRGVSPERQARQRLRLGRRT